MLIDNIGMSIGKRIREARKRAGMSQKALAAKVGIKQPTLSELETSESAGTTYLPTIAAALGVSALWLQTGRGVMAASEQLEETAVQSALMAETAREAQLLTVYRLAGEDGQAQIDIAVEEVLRGLSLRQVANKG